MRVGEAPAFPTLLASRRVRWGIAAVLLFVAFGFVSRLSFLNADTRGGNRDDIREFIETRYAPAQVVEIERVTVEHHDDCLVGFFVVRTDRGSYWLMDNPLLARPATPEAMNALRDAHERVVRCP
jgi:hypothetical protein